jgi:hypothetical protein
LHAVIHAEFSFTVLGGHEAIQNVSFYAVTVFEIAENPRAEGSSPPLTTMKTRKTPTIGGLSFSGKPPIG